MGLDYLKFLSQFGLRIQEMPLRNMHAILQTAPEDLISFVDGSPAAECFPVENICLKLKDGSQVELTGSETEVAQHYGATQGSVAYQTLLRDLVMKLHNPPCWNKSPDEGRTVVLPSSGATDSINQVFRIFTDPGDNILVEEFTYAGPITLCKSLQLNPLPVAIDADGLIPEALDKILSKWDPDAEPGSTDKPKVLYIIPTGQNPCGSALTLDRKRKIYQIAQKYNILIIEDDPYYLINFTERVPTFLSMDTEGRVIRLDSFSKSIAPGLRAGYISGPEQLMNKARMALSISTHGTSTLSQAVILAIFDHWGYEGFLTRAKGVADFYRKQRDLLVKCADKWLQGLVDYSVPVSGMFLWVKVLGCDNTKDLMYRKAVVKGVIATPGECFQPIEGKSCPYIRVSFSGQADKMDEGMRRLAEVLKESKK